MPWDESKSRPVSEEMLDLRFEHSEFGTSLTEEVVSFSVGLSFFFDFAGVGSFCTFFFGRLQESSGQEPGTWIFIFGISGSGVLTCALERLLGVFGFGLSTEEFALVDGAETLRWWRGLPVCNDSDLSELFSPEVTSLELVCFELGDARSFLWEVLSLEIVCFGPGDAESFSREMVFLELVCFRLGDAVDFGLDSEPDGGVELDEERGDLDFDSDRGGDLDREWDDLRAESEERLGFDGNLTAESDDGELDVLFFESEGRVDFDRDRDDLVVDFEGGVGFEGE